MPDRRHVLVVDDEPDVLLLCRVNLEFEGYDVTEASDGVEAMERVRERRPDIILLDVMMPRMDGWQGLKALKDDPEFSDVPVVMLTAKVQDQDQIRGWSSGAAEYITKPFSPLSLSQVLDDVLEHGRAEEERRRTLVLEKLQLICRSVTMGSPVAEHFTSQSLRPQLMVVPVQLPPLPFLQSISQGPSLQFSVEPAQLPMLFAHVSLQSRPGGQATVMAGQAPATEQSTWQSLPGGQLMTPWQSPAASQSMLHWSLPPPQPPSHTAGQTLVSSAVVGSPHMVHVPSPWHPNPNGQLSS